MAASRLQGSRALGSCGLTWRETWSRGVQWGNGIPCCLKAAAAGLNTSTTGECTLYNTYGSFLILVLRVKRKRKSKTSAVTTTKFWCHNHGSMASASTSMIAARQLCCRGSRTSYWMTLNRTVQTADCAKCGFAVLYHHQKNPTLDFHHLEPSPVVQR